MIKNFGENLKNLRRQKDLTQDEIARILSVSTQSVSRWETNMGYPDIEMLPAIANFYGVTVDSLLCLEIDRKNEKISKILNNVKSLRTKGDVSSSIDILRNGLKEFPYDFQLMSQLSSCLFVHGENDEEKKKNKAEVIEICEAILKDCRDDSLRHLAIQLLCYTYPEFGKRDKAIELVNKMPSYYATSNELYIKILTSNNEKMDEIQANIHTLIFLVSTNIEELCFLFDEYETKINILKSLVKIYEGFFDKEDYYFFHCRLQRIYRYIGALYADNKKYDEAIEYIEKAAFHALAFDNRPTEFTYKSSILFGFKNSIANSSRTSTKNESWVLLDKLSDIRYDFIRNDDKIQDIIKELKKTAKE